MLGRLNRLGNLSKCGINVVCTRQLGDGRLFTKDKIKEKSKDRGTDFIDWQKNIREQFREKHKSLGVDKINDAPYNEQFNLIVQDEDEETLKEKRMVALKAAVQLYNERQPRLKQDHPQFVSWCVRRMYEYDLVDEMELYELLFECFPPHMYHTVGLIPRMFPKPTPGLHVAMELVLIGEQRRVKPTYTMYRNVVRAFGERHNVTSMVRRWAWFCHIFRGYNPYPLKDGGYDFKSLASRHQEMAEYLAERTMDQRCTFKPVANALGEYVGTSIKSHTQEELSLIQVPDDNMRITGPHSIWVGRGVQRWYWVLRREERGEEFEGAPLGVFVSPYKEMSKEGAQIWLEDCRQQYKGIAGSNILFDVPEEILYIDPEEHFKERVSLFSDGIEDVHVESSVLPDLVEEGKKLGIKKVSASKQIKFFKDKDANSKDDEW